LTKEELYTFQNQR